MVEELKDQVCRANLQLEESGLDVWSWGSV